MRKFKINIFNLHLSAKIVIFNLLALVLLLIGILYLNQFREGLIESKIESLAVQSEIISATISASATSSKGTSLFIFDKNIDGRESFDQRVIKYRNYTINKKLLENIIGELINPEMLNAKIYDSNNNIIHNSNDYFYGKNINKVSLSPIKESFFKTFYSKFLKKIGFDSISDLNFETDYKTLSRALKGSKNIVVNKNEVGQSVVHVSMPIIKYKAIIGYLVLSTQNNAIDMIVYQERMSILKVFLIASLITIILSIILSNTIAKPMRELAIAADNVTSNLQARENIPDFSKRKDEIGDLSNALRNMTSSLFERIDTIERFSADIAHELRNPLTSLRSAIETFSVTKRKNDQSKLINIIQEDIDRIDRLIADISEISKLDTALTIEQREIIDIYECLNSLIQQENYRHKSNQIKLNHLQNGVKFYSRINKNKFNQVFINLFDNARSILKDNSEIIVNISNNLEYVIIDVEDQGGGIHGTKIDRVFERFYSDRLDKSRNKHTGLGLSIAKQIIESHDGIISVENYTKNQIKGAQFKIQIPRIK